MRSVHGILYAGLNWHVSVGVVYPTRRFPVPVLLTRLGYYTVQPRDISHVCHSQSTRLRAKCSCRYAHGGSRSSRLYSRSAQHSIRNAIFSLCLSWVRPESPPHFTTTLLPKDKPPTFQAVLQGLYRGTPHGTLCLRSFSTRDPQVPAYLLHT